MWTNENRGRYDRSKLRYPSDLTDETEPLILPAKRGGNRWTVDARERAPSTGAAAAVDWPRNAQPQGARLPACGLDSPDASVIATLGVSRNCSQRPAGAAFAIRRALYFPALRWNARYFSRGCTGCS